MKKTLSIPGGVFFWLYKLLIFTSKVNQYETYQNINPVFSLPARMEFLYQEKYRTRSEGRSGNLIGR